MPVEPLTITGALTSPATLACPAVVTDNSLTLPVSLTFTPQTPDCPTFQAPLWPIVQAPDWLTCWTPDPTIVRTTRPISNPNTVSVTAAIFSGVASSGDPSETTSRWTSWALRVIA